MTYPIRTSYPSWRCGDFPIDRAGELWPVSIETEPWSPEGLPKRSMLEDEFFRRGRWMALGASVQPETSRFPPFRNRL